VSVAAARHGLWLPGTPPPPAAENIAYGFNISADNGFTGSTETATQAHDRLVSSYGLTVVPIAKMFYGGMPPAAWDSNFEGVVTGKRVIICYGAGTSEANAAAGGDNARMAAHAASVPRGWHVIYVHRQEPDDEMKAGTLNVADYKAVYAQHYPVIHAAQKAPNPGAGLLGNKLELWSCFQAPVQLGLSAAQSASWHPDPGTQDGNGWDCYLNPVGVGGTRYNSLYDPHGPNRFQQCIDVNNLMGMHKWGVMEYAAPWRNWDNGAQARNTYMVEFTEFLRAGYVGNDSQLHKPEHIVLFNRKGTQWDQRFTRGGAPTTYDHSGGPGGPDNPATVPVPVLPDEPFGVSYSAYVNGGLQTFTGLPTDF
jgi:hypothetical protein